MSFSNVQSEFLSSEGIYNSQTAYEYEKSPSDASHKCCCIMQERMKCYNPELWGKLLKLLPEKLVSICAIKEGQKINVNRWTSAAIFCPNVSQTKHKGSHYNTLNKTKNEVDLKEHMIMTICWYRR